MYTIRDRETGQYFCYKHDKIIIFEIIEEAESFINQFFQYAMMRAMNESPDLIFEILRLQNTVLIEPVSNNLTNSINFNEIKK